MVHSVSRASVLLLIGASVVSAAACGDTTADAIIGGQGSDLTVPDGSTIDAPQPLGVLVAEHVTPNAIGWHWDISALPSVVSYVMWFGTDLADVERRQGSTRSWTLLDDPNFEWSVDSHLGEPAQRTVLTGLEPDTEYHAHLLATQLDGSVVLVAAGSGTTPPTARCDIEIFDEEFPSSTPLGFADTLSTNAHTGSASLWANGDGTWINLTLRNLATSIDALSDSWNTAFLEFFIRVETASAGAYPVYYLTVGISPTAPPDVHDYHLTHYATLPHRLGWHRRQIPLALMRRASDNSLTTAASFGSILNWLRIGFETPPGGIINVDGLRLCH